MNAHIEKMVNFTALKTETVGGLRRLTECFNGHLSSLVVLGGNIPGDYLLYIYQSKLDPETEREWIKSLADPT
jgi:hypothetical protein